MPLVQIRYKPGEVGEFHLKLLSKSVLPFEVARALNVEELPEAHLTPADIVVWVSEVGELDSQSTDVEIIIDAHDFGPRRDRIEKASFQIAKAVRDLLKGSSGAVWIRLFPTAYTEF